MYHVHLSERDINYLAGRTMSDRMREAVETFILDGIGGITDAFRTNPDNRVGGPYFYIQLVFVDYWGDRLPHTLDFFVNDARAPMGVLVVAYVEMDRRP